jgi:hypothetical protein
VEYLVVVNNADGSKTVEMSRSVTNLTPISTIDRSTKDPFTTFMLGGAQETLVTVTNSSIDVAVSNGDGYTSDIAFYAHGSVVLVHEPDQFSGAIFTTSNPDGSQQLQFQGGGVITTETLPAPKPAPAGAALS